MFTKIPPHLSKLCPLYPLLKTATPFPKYAFFEQDNGACQSTVVLLIRRVPWKKECPLFQGTRLIKAHFYLPTYAPYIPLFLRLIYLKKVRVFISYLPCTRSKRSNEVC